MTNENRLTVSGEANLLLCDGATLNVPKGIAVNEGASLTIWQQSAGSGTLVAVAETDSYNAAIGGDSGAQPITDTVTALYRFHEAAVAYFNSTT